MKMMMPKNPVASPALLLVLNFPSAQLVNAFAPPDMFMNAGIMPSIDRKIRMNASHVLMLPSAMKMPMNASHSRPSDPVMLPPATTKADVMIPAPRLMPTLRVRTTRTRVKSGGMSGIYSHDKKLSICISSYKIQKVTRHYD